MNLTYIKPAGFGRASGFAAGRIYKGSRGHSAPTMQENRLKILFATSEGNGEATDAEIVMDGMQNIANRITTGLML